MTYASERLREIEGMRPITRVEPLEHDEQVVVIDWWAYVCKSYRLPEFALYAIPNAGAGAQKGQAGKMKAEGVRSGVPDLFLAVPIGRRHGLYIEMKRRDGRNKPTERQVEVMGFLSAQGYDARVCYGGEEAMREIRAYLERR